jgi:hypothetical protein
MSHLVPAFLQHTGSRPGEASTTAPLLGEALISSAALKALLPAVPKIHPQLPTFNQTVTVNNTATVCNETEINFNRTADQPRLLCNATNNGTNSSIPNVGGAGGALPSIGFFKGLQDMNSKFMAETKDNKNKTSSNAPGGNAALAARLAQLPGGGLMAAGKQAADPFAAWTKQRQDAPAAGKQKPPDTAALAAKLAALGYGTPGKLQQQQPPVQQRYKAPIGPHRYKAPIGPQRPPVLPSSGSSSSSSSESGDSEVATAATKPQPT